VCTRGVLGSPGGEEVPEVGLTLVEPGGVVEDCLVSEQVVAPRPVRARVQFRYDVRGLDRMREGNYSVCVRYLIEKRSEIQHTVQGDIFGQNVED
jgi:hypothetical protein